MYRRIDPIDSGQAVVFVFLLACYLAVQGSFLTFSTFQECQWGLKSLGYQATQGQVLNSVIRQNGYRRGGFCLYVTYTYSDMQGHTYEDSRFNTQTPCLPSLQSEALTLLQNGDYTAGKPVKVYYDPRTPFKAVLNNGLQLTSCLGLIWGFCLLLLSFLCFRYCKQQFVFSKWT